jgi:acyl-CoA synthetase (AMP-forming)/AMP-acid ligase II
MTIYGMARTNWLPRIGLARDRSLVLGTLFERLAAVHGDALVVDEAGPSGAHLTYRQAAARVASAAGAIAGLIERGDRVVVATPNGYDAFLLCCATSRAGGIAVPVKPQMTDAEVDHVIADSGATLVVRDRDELGEGSVASLAVAVPAEAGDVAAIFYTSGTTGKPKGARLTHRALIAQAQSAAVYPSGLRRDEAVAGLPVAHIMGFVVLLSLAVAGIPVHFLPRFRPDEALDAIEQRRATIFIGVPAMYRLLLEAGAERRDLRSIRVWASGADVMPTDLARRFQRMGASATLPGGVSVGDALFVEGYGMVEVGGGVAAKVSPPGMPSPLGGFLGVPLPNYRFRVVDDAGREVRVGQVGELLVKGPGVLQGYHGDAAATAAVLTDDGWLRTGDLVRRGPLGLVSFAGRSKDVIKNGGYSVYAVEVQAALEEHPSVAEAAVLGIPDERLGERVVAAVRLLPGEAANEPELIAWCAGRLSSYKVPTAIRIVDSLPRTGTEKVKKSELRSLF